MFLETEIEKDKTFMPGEDMVVQIRDGLLSMLIKNQKKEPRAEAHTDSTSTEHSTSDLECQ
jgi:hypothetical protein